MFPKIAVVDYWLSKYRKAGAEEERGRARKIWKLVFDRSFYEGGGGGGIGP